MQIEKVPVGSLVLDPTNARKHDNKNLESIKGSLAKFGQQKPLVVTTDNVVIAGNGTLEAAKSLGWEHVDIHRTVLKGAEAMAYALADNRTSELASWDDEILKEQIAALASDGWDVGDFGFDLDDFDLSEKTEGNTDPDEVPEVEQNKFKVERGQIWQLGEHRLMCGDSTSKDDVEKLMAGEKADMVFTDPPYRLTGGGFSGEFVNSGWMAPEKFKDKGRSELFEVPEFADWMAILPSACSKDAELFIMSNVRNAKPMMVEIEKIKGKIHNILVMRKDTAFPHVWYSTNTEFVLYYYFGKAKDPIQKCQSNVFDVKMPRGEEKEHVSQKPVDFIAQIIGNHVGKNVLEPFCGSGSTLIACEKTNRKCYGMEIDPHYCSVIIERYQNFTGKQATKIGD